MATHYDVIIIGSGAGGGTLFHALAPTGKRILLLERGDYVPREKANWSTRAVNLEGRYNTKEVWRDARRARAPPAHQLLRRRQHQVLRRRALPPAPRGLRRDQAPGRRLAGVADRLRGPGALLHAGRAALPRARRARRRSHRSAGERAVPAPGGEPRAAHPAARRRHGAPGPAAVSRAARHHARRAEPAEEPVHPLRDLRRPSVPDLRQVRRPGGLRRPDARAAPERDAADGRPRHAPADQRVGPRGDRAWTSSGTAHSETLLGRHRRRVGGGHQLGRAAAPLGQRPASRAASPTAPTWSAGTTWVTSTRSCWPCPSVRTPPSSRRRSRLNDFYFGSPEWEFPMGHISFVGKVDADTLRAGAPAIAPGWTLDLMAKHSMDFWLTSEDLPDPENRVTLDRDGSISLQLHAEQRGGPRRLIDDAQAPHEAADEVRGARARVPRGAVRAQPVPGPAHSAGRAWRIRTAPSASAATRRRPRSTPTARRTRSTTSTWWTGASSPRAGP